MATSAAAIARIAFHSRPLVSAFMQERLPHLERLRLGEEIVIGKAGRPVARLVPVEQAPARRTPGSARGRFRMARNFDAALPKTVLDAFEK